MAVIFALRKFRIFLQSERRFELVKGHQALKYALPKRDIHGRLPCWLDFLAVYDFTISYKPGIEKKSADFLSHASYWEPAIDTGDDEGKVNVVLESDEDTDMVL